MDVSYCRALCHLSDVGAEVVSNLQIWRQFLRTWIFYIGGLSRNECKSIDMKIRNGRPIGSAPRSKCQKEQESA